VSVFADFIDLQTAVVETVARPDITDVMPRLVKQAESDFNRKLRLAEQIDLENVVIASGVGALPADFQELVGVYDTAGYEYIAQPPQMIRIDQTRGYFSIIGTNIHAPVDETLIVQYYGSIPTISGSATATNWLLARYPKLYLYAVSVEAAKHVRDAETAQALMPLLMEEYDAVRADDEGRRYARARVRLPGVTP
jgi:hypothetical protein